MGKVLPLILFVIYIRASHGGLCRNGWTPFKTDICLKLFYRPMSYNDAKDFCSLQSDSIYTPFIVQAKPLQLYSFLSKIEPVPHNNIWLGAKLDDTEQFESNLEDLIEDSNNNKCLCIEPRINKWQNVDCEQLNLPLCQRKMDWAIEDFMRKITENYNSIMALNSSLIRIEDAMKKIVVDQDSAAALRYRLTPIEDTMKNITDNHDSIVALSSRLTPIEDTVKNITVNYDSIVAQSSSLIPIGFIYIQYRNQISPSQLWPSMNWTEVTSEYAGQFFRALGGDSAQFGEVQTSCAPRISKIEVSPNNDCTRSIDLPKSGWSSRLFTGLWNRLATAASFHIESCEVRPVNSAVKIWKRVV